MSNKYNGWTNRETWLVNLWFGDYFQDCINDGIEPTRDFIKDTVETHFEQYTNGINDGFVNDLLNSFDINYWELAAFYERDYQEAYLDRGVLEHAAWYDTSAELA